MSVMAFIDEADKDYIYGVEIVIGTLGGDASWLMQ